ncbi:MAG TPA: hypothetical protein VIJ10_08320 [Vicinamibacteria bacterium]|jgi:hypothetical protein
MTLPGFEAGQTTEPLEFRLQIVVEVGPAGDETAARDSAPPGTDAEASRLPRLVESARSLLRDMSRDLDVRVASFAWPGGVRLVAQGSAMPQDLGGIRAVAETLGEAPLPLPPGART